jgi:putative intracellular protease/amidase
MAAPIQIGLLVFPKVTQLDLTGPLQVFSSVPGAQVHLIWKRIEPVASDSVLTLTPTTSFADCPQLDVICVPGGAGTDDMVNDEEMLGFLRDQAVGAKYITSVCTGSLVLGAAGLLRGYRAATHWTATEFLGLYGATPAKTRVCIDRNRRRRHRRDRFCADAGFDPDRPADRASHPASARIQPGAAVRFRLARYRTGRNSCATEGKKCGRPSPPCGRQPACRGAASMTLQSGAACH